MTAPSPGPWVLTSRYGQLKTEIASARGSAVCTVWTHREDLTTESKYTTRGPVMDPEGMANAKLIAAAPALLATCKAFLEWFEKGESDPRDAMIVRKRAAAAVAQAGGGK